MRLSAGMTDAPASNTDQIDYWNAQAGDVWARLQDELDRQLEPLGRAAITALDPRPGEQILDIGCGCGQSTLALAEAVGPQGAVIGADISRPMLDIARARLAEQPQARLLEADVQTYPFPRQSLDAVFSRFGVMFFEDPTAAFANVRAALKPGGRIAFVCWRGMMENPWMTIPLLAALQKLPPPTPPQPGAPGPFAFADPERVRAVLDGAGFEAVEIRPHDTPIGGNDLDASVRMALRIGPLGALLRDNPQVRPADVEDDIRQALMPHVRDGRLYVDSATWIVTARA
jgi:SAM-dependent methyltransferase